MRNRYALTFSLLAMVLAGSIVPAFSQAAHDMRRPPHQRANGMNHGMMSGDMMNGGMMSRGCMGMMQSMNGGGGPPNSQWQKRAPSVPN